MSYKQASYSKGQSQHSLRPQLAHGIYQLFPLSISLPISFSLSLFLSFSATFASSWSQPPSFLDRSPEPNLVPFRLTIFNTLPLSIGSSLLLFFLFLLPLSCLYFRPVCLISHSKFFVSQLNPLSVF